MKTRVFGRYNLTRYVYIYISYGNLRVPPQCHPPPRNKALLRDYQPLITLRFPWITQIQRPQRPPSGRTSTTPYQQNAWEALEDVEPVRRTGKGNHFLYKTAPWPRFSSKVLVTGGFPKMTIPPKHPKMIIFSRKTHGCWGNPPF